MEPRAWKELERVDQHYMGRELGHFFIKRESKGEKNGRVLRDVPGEAWEGEGPQSKEADSLVSWDAGPTLGLGCVKNLNHCSGEATGPEGMGNKRQVMRGAVSAGS